MQQQKHSSLGNWFRSGEPWIWFNAAAVGISIFAVVGILLLIAARGFAHFWPSSVALLDYRDSFGEQRVALGEITEVEYLPVAQYLESSGGDPGEGGDFSGDFVFAVNIGGSAESMRMRMSR